MMEISTTGWKTIATIGIWGVVLGILAIRPDTSVDTTCGAAVAATVLLWLWG
jgi:hypothetical protein